MHTSESRPSRVRVASKSRPSHVRVASESRLSRMRVTSDGTSRVRVTSESRPSHVQVVSGSHPSRVRVASESHPSHSASGPRPPASRAAGMRCMQRAERRGGPTTLSSLPLPHCPPCPNHTVSPAPTSSMGRSQLGKGSASVSNYRLLYRAVCRSQIHADSS